MFQEPANQPTDNLWNFAQIIGNKNLSLCGHILKRNNFRLSDVCMYFQVY